MEITAVLLEVASIQQYIFSSNKLKENLGASHLVEKVFENNLKPALDELKIKYKNFDGWKDDKKDDKAINICTQDIDFEVGYIGGGNALLLFKHKDQAIKLIKQWTKKLLENTPGIIPLIAIKSIDCSMLTDETRFPENISELFQRLKLNKSKYQPQTSLQRHGITAKCIHTGLSAEYYDKEEENYISSVAMSKKNNSSIANDEMHKMFKDILKDYYEFPIRLDYLGQIEGDDHISIVHIDGNRIGHRFKECKTLNDIRALSTSVRKATETSFKKLLESIINKCESGKFDEILKRKDNFLPIRPIIMGGDDVTFVTHGKLGVYFAEIFMKEFAKQKASDGGSLSSCAGIAITGTSYPFYRSYELAEELCKHAKERSRKETDSSWLDFHIAYGGFSGSIEDIRNKNYKASGRDLCLRPYRIGDSIKDHHNLDECLFGIRHFNEYKWPRSKLKELRKILTLSIPAVQIFIQEMNFRKKELPEITGCADCKNTGWINEKVTPYFDMLELMEFYPVDLIGSGK